jgi:hypothetical protein
VFTSHSPLCIGLFLMLSAGLFTACQKGSTNIVADNNPCVLDRSRDDLGNFFRAGSSANPTAFFELIQPSIGDILTVGSNQFRLEGCVFSRAPLQTAELFVFGVYPSSSTSFRTINLINGELGQQLRQSSPDMQHLNVQVIGRLFQVRNPCGH